MNVKKKVYLNFSKLKERKRKKITNITTYPVLRTANKQNIKSVFS